MKIFKDGAYWPLIIVGLLLISVGSNVYLIYRAVNDPSFAVEPDYYQKAVDFDAIQEAQRTSDRLGWKPDVSLDADSQLRVELRDAKEMPVEGVKLHLEAFPITRSQQFLKTELEEVSPGVYLWKKRLSYHGQWEFRLTGDRGDQHFIHTTRLMVK